MCNAPPLHGAQHFRTRNLPELNSSLGTRSYLYYMCITNFILLVLEYLAPRSSRSVLYLSGFIWIETDYIPTLARRMYYDSSTESYNADPPANPISGPMPFSHPFVRVLTIHFCCWMEHPRSGVHLPEVKLLKQGLEDDKPLEPIVDQLTHSKT
jgi:hypothetical protein